jgi:PRC-barrel domain
LNYATTVRAELGGRIEEPDGCRGYEVRDPLGQRIGQAEELFVNGDGGPEYVRVRIGFLRARSVLIPVEGAEVDAERRTIVLG